MTPEEQIIYAIKHLEETNQVIDDYSGKGYMSYQLGAFFPASGVVPHALWGRRSLQRTCQAGLGGGDPRLSDSFLGARSAVRVKLRT